MVPNMTKDIEQTEDIQAITPGDRVEITVTIHHPDGRTHELAHIVEMLRAEGIEISVAVAGGADVAVAEFLETAVRGVNNVTTKGVKCTQEESRRLMGFH